MTTILRAGRTTEDPRCDWVPPPDQRHVEKYPMLAASEVWDVPAPVPVVFGVPWYAKFDADALVERRGRGRAVEYWIPEGELGENTGGHCIAAEPNHPDRHDTDAWWRFYDQGAEGACVGFGWSRAMSLLNRRRYAARPFYWEVQRDDPWPGGAYDGADPFYEGTSTRHGGDVLRDKGHLPQRGQRVEDWSVADGLQATRWATSVEQIHKALGVGPDGVVWLNSWGRDGYPHRVHVPDSVVDRLVIREEGECGVPTDR